MKFYKPNFWDQKNISFFSIFLLPISLIIIVLNFLKKFFIKKNKINLPIICIGNIYLGGTGKTPLTLEIFSMLENLKRKPAFIRKKYDNQKDEVTLQKQIGPVYESSKRINAIDKATKDGKDIFILDDGFQDLSINKDLTIICFNEKQWIGNGLVIPAGPLRENLTALKRAECIIINGSKNIHIEKKILDINSNIKIFYSKYVALNISSFKNKDVIAFAGIGNNKNFFHLLESNEIKILKKINFPDHYNYSNRELENLVKSAKEKNAILLTTEKDYLRIDDKYKKNINYLKIKTDINNKNQLVEEIKKII
tara:strand:- start:920 stop:1849 length:930 start_codon:yes stop_codon:yes gene_type:complete